MQKGKVLALYMTVPDLMRSGHRMRCEDIECDPDGIIGDMNYETPRDYVMLLTCQKSYDIAKEADIIIDEGVLMESVYVDIDLYHLNKGSIIELGEMLMEVEDHCQAFGYLMALDPELPELLQGKRGLFVRPLEYGRISLDDEVKVIKET